MAIDVDLAQTLYSQLVYLSLPCPYVLIRDSLSLGEIEGGSLCGAKRVWAINGHVENVGTNTQKQQTKLIQ